MLLQCSELVASYCSSPQRRDPTISGLTAPSVTTYPTNSRLPLQTSDISRVSSLSPLTSPNCKRPKYPQCCLVESKTPLWQWVAHFTWQPGSSGSTTKVRTFSFPVVPVRHLQPATAQTDPGGPVRDWGRAASQPEQIRYSNATRQVRKSDFAFFAPQLSIKHFFLSGYIKYTQNFVFFFH